MEDGVVQLQKTVEDVEGMEEETICLTDVLISDNQSSFFLPWNNQKHPLSYTLLCYCIASVKGHQ